MKFIQLSIIALILIHVSVSAKMGCLANSRNRKQRFDTKAYYPADCNCPCDRYMRLADRNQCTECGHFHDAQPLVVVPSAPLADLSKNPYPESPRNAVQKLITSYKSRSSNNE